MQPVLAEPLSIYETRVTHIRRTPWKRTFAHRSAMWVVDIDRIAQRRPVAAFFKGAVVATDHLDGKGGTLRDALTRFADQEGIDLRDARVLLAAQPRGYGFCFNPISVWWCLDNRDDVIVTVVEVHNTYGDRHAYSLRPGADGRVRVDKAMYVSPFHGVDGTYEVIAPVPGGRLEISVTLRTADDARFSASLVGRRLDSPPWWTPLASLLDALRIRVHGAKLWLRRLPVHPRPVHHQEALK